MTRRSFPSGQRWAVACFLVCLVAPLLLGGCVVERTVTTASGEVIYSEPEVHMPFESEEKQREEIRAKERKLGW